MKELQNRANKKTVKQTNENFKEKPINDETGIGNKKWVS